jgi:hypothetical protein
VGNLLPIDEAEPVSCLDWRACCIWLTTFLSHGATASTPVMLLNALKPRNIIISTPSSIVHGHPREFYLFPTPTN